MKYVLNQLRLAVAEKLLSLAMEVAPKGSRERSDIALFVTDYCEKRLNAAKRTQ